MAAQRQHTLPPATSAFQLPYSPSWLNRLINGIEAMPGPTWLYYVAGVVLTGIVLLAVSWMIGVLPTGSFDFRFMSYGLYPVYFVALMHYLDRHARYALESFRPALQIDDMAYRRLEYELTVVPARGAWLALAVAVLPGVFITLDDQSDPLIRSGNPFGIAIVMISTTFTLACLLIFAYHTVRQLRMVSRIHTLMATINTFHPGPVYAFSDLTARTGIGLLIFATYLLLVSPLTPTDPFGYGLLATIGVVAVAAFILPLLGMHQRLVKEKASLQTEINHSLEIAHGELQERVQSRNFAGVDDLDKVLATLLSLREVAAKLSTWPWQAETLAGFVSALLVPILIWALTTLLERVLNF